MKPVYILLLSLSLLIAACSAFPQAGADLAIPSKWKLESFGKMGAETPTVDGSVVTLEFNDNHQLGGKGGCNSFGAQYEVKGSTLVIKELISTLMACMDEQTNQQEAQYFAALQNASSFKITGEQLVIFFDDGKSQLNFIKQ